MYWVCALNTFINGEFTVHKYILKTKQKHQLHRRLNRMFFCSGGAATITSIKLADLESFKSETDFMLTLYSTFFFFHVNSCETCFKFLLYKITTYKLYLVGI